MSKLSCNLSEPRPVDPGENSRYSRCDQLNPSWWQTVEKALVTGNAGLDGPVEILEDAVALPWFNRTMVLYPGKREILFREGDPAPGYQEGLVALALLEHLVKRGRLEPEGELVNENHLPGGPTFFRGPHVMASVRIAREFARKGGEFLRRGRYWGGRPEAYGEFALRFTVFPGLDWVVVLWEEDEEFPARAQYLFDRGLARVFRLDVIWALGNVIAEKLLLQKRSG